MVIKIINISYIYDVLYKIIYENKNKKKEDYNIKIN